MANLILTIRWWWIYHHFGPHCKCYWCAQCEWLPRQNQKTGELDSKTYCELGCHGKGMPFTSFWKTGCYKFEFDKYNTVSNYINLTEKQSRVFLNLFSKKEYEDFEDLNLKYSLAKLGIKNE